MFLFRVDVSRGGYWWGGVRQPLVEEWIAVPVDLVATSGLQLHRAGDMVPLQLDPFHQHSISAVLVLRQSQPSWGLQIHAHGGQRVTLDVTSGSLTLLESAVCRHGRPQPLAGQHELSVTVHFRTLDYLDRLIENGLLDH